MTETTGSFEKSGWSELHGVTTRKAEIPAESSKPSASAYFAEPGKN
jgi:hypothetical protein